METPPRPDSKSPQPAEAPTARRASTSRIVVLAALGVLAGFCGTEIIFLNNYAYYGGTFIFWPLIPLFFWLAVRAARAAGRATGRPRAPRWFVLSVFAAAALLSQIVNPWRM